MKHNYELEYVKGEHKDYLDSYVWECANCGAVSFTGTTEAPCSECKNACNNCECEPVQIRTITTTTE
jgi:hypothetical protein